MERVHAEPGDAAESDKAPSAAAWGALAILTAAYMVSFIDRKLPFILADSIKAELGLSDTQLGLLTGAMFAIVYSTVAIPIARIADRHSRKRLIAVGVVAWSVLTAAGGLAKNFWQLAFCRMGVAAGESVLTPAAHSIIADYFSLRLRARALAIYVMGAQLGVLAGLALGGLINELADWRTAMFLLGAPGVVLTLAVMFLLREPPRRDPVAHKPEEPAPSVWTVAGSIVRQPTLFHLIAASTLAGLAGGGLQAFVPSHVIRTFELGTAQVGLAVGLAGGLGGLGGTLLGGVIGDWLRKAARWKALCIVGVAEALAAPCLAMALISGNFPLFLALLFTAQVLGGISGAPTYATLQAMLKSNTHAQGTAIYLFCVSGLGLALGPVVTGMMSDAMSDKGSQASLQTALLLLMLLKLWAAAHYGLSGYRLYRRDRGAAELPVVQPATP